MTIKESIQKLASGGAEMYAKICKVNSVNLANNTIDVSPIDGDADIKGVLLQAQINLSEGILIIPVVGSEVIVGFINKNNGYVISYSSIEKIEIKSIGKIKISNQVDSLNQILNDLIIAIRAITVTTPSGPSTVPLINDLSFEMIVQRLNLLME